MITILTTISNHNNTMHYRSIISIILSAALLSCSKLSVPSQYTESSDYPNIYPDYTKGITIPINIAPLTFELTEETEGMIARFSFRDIELVCGDKLAIPNISEWEKLKKAAVGNAIKVEVFAKDNGNWVKYKPFDIYISTDSIDPYISYRLIPPSYVSYEELTINQRCLENFDEEVIYDNRLCSERGKGQCINCHHYQNYNPKRMQFHARQNHGGTFISIDGKHKKINMKHDSILSAGVYPAWHPSMNIIAYSTNKTLQSFHTRDINKIEVLDAASDLILYDIDQNKVTTIEKDPHEFETYPCWTPDGKMLYYCSAHFEYATDTISRTEALNRYKDIKYNIYRKRFNPNTKTFSAKELVYDATSIGKSATLPRISPDGRFLLFTQGEWGCFHIWHRDADLWIMDLSTLQAKPLSICNSPNVESYHSWSNNGKWIIFSSRRNDGVYTRLYIAHIDKNGQASVPFELPQSDTDYHLQLTKSYNIPEFMKGPVSLKPQEIANILKTEGETIIFSQHP